MPAAVGVSDIHVYPLRPKGFEEPLFPTAASRREVAEHLLEAPWLARVSELEGQTGEVAHALNEPVELKNFGNLTELVRPRARRRRCSWRRQRVVKVLDRWREVRAWWEEENGIDRLVFKVLLAGGPVVEVARERSGAWFLVGVAD